MAQEALLAKVCVCVWGGGDLGPGHANSGHNAGPLYLEHGHNLEAMRRVELQRPQAMATFGHLVFLVGAAMGRPQRETRVRWL